LNKGRRALLIISALLLIVALVFVAYMVFRVREVAVVGCQSLDAKDVASMSGLKYGQCIFLLDKQEVMDALAADSRIKPVSIDVEYPDRVTITIKERIPTAYIEKSGALIVIDDEGWVLDVKNQPAGVERPLVYGLQADAFEVGQQLSSGDMFRVDVMTRVLQAVEKAGIDLESLDVTLAADIMLTTADGLVVELGDDTQLDKKMALVNTLVKEIASMGKTGGILNVSSVDKAYFREKSS
jgi:cell division septal protein FtsQ